MRKAALDMNFHPGDRISCRQSTLWFCAAPFGGLVSVAVKIGIHPNTLYMAARGVSVSPSTRKKIEQFFDMTLELLQRPVAEILYEAAGANE